MRAAVLVALVAAGPACRGRDGRDAGPVTTNTSFAPAANWSAEPTRRCLEGSGATVGPVEPRDQRLQALRDLAQQTSFEARFGAAVVAVAVTAGPAASAQLADLLLVPDDPYRVVVDRNALVMHLPAADAAFRATVACLRE